MICEDDLFAIKQKSQMQAGVIGSEEYEFESEPFGKEFDSWFPDSVSVCLWEETGEGQSQEKETGAVSTDHRQSKYRTVPKETYWGL